MSINTALGDKHFVDSLQEEDIITRVDNIYKAFFSLLKKAIGDGVARTFITGVAPLALAELTSGFNIAFDITMLAPFDRLYGFEAADVREGLSLIRPALKKETVECIQVDLLFFFCKIMTYFYFLMSFRYPCPAEGGTRRISLPS